MTTTLPTLDARDLRLTTSRAVRSEWLKLTTLRSTWVTAGALVLVLAALGILGAANVPAAGVTVHRHVPRPARRHRARGPRRRRASARSSVHASTRPG